MGNPWLKEGSFPHLYDLSSPKKKKKTLCLRNEENSGPREVQRREDQITHQLTSHFPDELVLLRVCVCRFLTAVKDSSVTASPYTKCRQFLFSCCLSSCIIISCVVKKCNKSEIFFDCDIMDCIVLFR